MSPFCLNNTRHPSWRVQNNHLILTSKVQFVLKFLQILKHSLFANCSTHSNCYLPNVACKSKKLGQTNKLSEASIRCHLHARTESTALSWRRWELQIHTLVMPGNHTQCDLTQMAGRVCFLTQNAVLCASQTHIFSIRPTADLY